MSILLKLIHSFKEILIKIPESIFVGLDTVLLKFIWKSIGFRIAKMILTMKNKIAEFSLSYIKALSMATVLKTVWYWQRARQMGQWNRVENLDRTRQRGSSYF